MTIDYFDPILVAWIGFVIAVLVLVLVNLIAEVKKQKARQGRADDILEKSRQSQERNIVILDRYDAILSRIEAILERLEGRDAK